MGDKEIIESELNRKSLHWMTRHGPLAEWFIIEAEAALKRDSVRAIVIGGELYLARFFLGNPSPLKEGHPARFNSSGELMLHWIVRPDADRAIHDHPWAFTSLILSGGYRELWKTRKRESDIGLDLHDPELNQTIRKPDLYRYMEFSRDHAHMIAEVEKDTWTLVRSRPNNGDHTWGFYPPGKKWVDWKTYLDVNGASGDSL